MKTETAACESLGGMAIGREMIESRDAALYHTLDNPIRRHDADGFTPVAEIAPHVASDALHEAGMILPTDPAERKNLPITTGVLDYFPRALAEVARVSKAGSDQHHPGQPLHWEKGKSTDHADCIARHLMDRFSRDSDGQRHAAKLAWRALALLETLLEAEQ
jgi:hypothetical protein